MDLAGEALDGEPRRFGCGHNAGEGTGPGVPVAADAGNGALRHDQ